MYLPPKPPFFCFKRPKGVCGTSGRSVNIDFRFLRIFRRLEAVIRNWLQGGARQPLLPTRLYSPDTVGGIQALLSCEQKLSSFPILCGVDVSYESLPAYCVSSPDSSLSDKSFLMLSNHLRFGLPLLLFHSTSITITLLPTHSSCLLNTCPYHFKLLSCTFLDISPTVAIPVILSFLILPSLHNYLAVPSPYCASILLDEALYRTPFSRSIFIIQSCFSN